MSGTTPDPGPTRPTSATSPTSPPRPAGTARTRTFRALAVLAVLAVLGGGVAPWAYSSFIDTTAKDRLAADPPPKLFPDSNLVTVKQDIAQQAPVARRLMAGWWAAHDATPDDTAFVAWLQTALPGPPSAAVRAGEIRQVQQIAPTRTSAGVTAATWLEADGKKDVWKLAAHDQAELLPAATGESVKNDVDDMLSMSKTVADALGARYEQSAPYVVDPSLRTDHTVAPGDVCPCSYPSRHATSGAASTTYLTGLAPPPRRGVPLVAGRDRLVADLHGRSRRQRHLRRHAAGRHDR